jgi:Leucine rich repeat
MSDDAFRLAQRKIIDALIQNEKKLYLHVNQLPPEIGELTALRALDLRGDQLITLPPEIGRLAALQVLTIRGSQLVALPPEIGQLTALQALTIRNQELESLPPEIGQLAALRNDLRGNNLGLLPPEIGQLRALRSLDLRNNRLNALPPEIGQLAALQILSLSGNQLSALPPEIGQLAGLISLDVRGNQLSALPAGIGQLTRCTFLDLINNQLSTMPPEISQLAALRHLYLTNNQLSELPPEIGQLRELRCLFLSGNQLRTLPPAVGQLTGLRTLDFSGNKLSALPPEIGQLRSLAAADADVGGLLLEENPLTYPYPILMAEGQPSATVNVLAWLRGELDPQILPQPISDAGQTRAENASTAGESESKDNERDIHLQQRPAAFRFRIENAKIDALSERPEVADKEIAKDLYAELIVKAEELQSRLAKTNSEPRVRRSVGRLLSALAAGFEDVRPGVLLSRLRSIEADRNAFDTEEGRQELFLDAIAMMDDVLLSLQDLVASYPIVRTIEAERVALSIQRDTHILEAVAAEMDVIKEEANASVAVTPVAVAALKENDLEIEDAITLDVRAGLIADQLLVVRNFTSEVVRYVREHGSRTTTTLVAGLEQAGSELGDLGQKSWEAAKANLPDGVGAAARILPVGLLVVLLTNIAGPVAGLAALAGGFKQLAKAITQLREVGKLPRDERPNHRPSTRRKTPKSKK